MDCTALKEDLLEFHKRNPSADVPYHNNNHMSVMTDIAVALYLREVKVPNVHDMGVLITAGMLHDWGHSAGKLKDHDNIGIALEGFDQYRAEHNTMVVGAEPQFDAEVRRAIICTEFPFIHVPTTLVEECLRDADILYACMTQDPEIILTHLREEIEVSWNRTISREEMFAGQERFFKEATLFTDTGKELWENYASKYLKKMGKALQA